MFEGWVYQLVAGYLGNYIKDIHREQFRIGLWSGVALVENAELRLEAFDYLQLPFAIKQGFVGKLRLQIPWKTLFWEPIVVALEDVYICASPREECEFDVEASENRALAAKKAKLAAAEITKLSSQVPDEKVRESFMSHLLAKLIANIQVTVRDIHVRYVDDKVDSERNYDFGAKLAGLTVCTSEARGAAKNKANMVYKSLEVHQFALYWNSASLPRQAKNSSFTKWFSKREANVTHILNPIDASAKLTVNRAAASDGAGAQYALTINADKLDFNLGNCQLYEMFLLLESLKIAQLRERYGRFRPHIGTSQSVDWQHLWWQYAINAVASDVRKRLRRTSWRYLGWRLECRRRYIALYKSKLETLQEGKPPDDTIASELEELEKELDMDMILSFRSLAEQKCELLSVVVKEDDVPDAHKKSSDDQSNLRSRGWLSLFSFGMLGGSGTMQAAAEVTGPFSDEIMKDLYEATNFHPTNSHPNGEWSKGYSLMTVSFQLRKATATLEMSDTRRGLVEVTLEGLYAGFRKLHGLSTAAVAVKTFAVADLCTKDSCFPNIVVRKGFSSVYAPSKNKTYAEALYSIGISQRDLSEAAFSVDIELSEDPNVTIAIAVKPVEVVYSTSIVLGFIEFFKLPTLLEINEGPETLHMSRKTRTKLMLTVDVKSPVFLIPECNSSGESAVLVVALERLTLSEVYGLRELSNDVKARLPNLESELQNAVKHFDVKLTGLQIGVGRGHIDPPLWPKIVDCFDVQLDLLEYRDALGTHWKVEGDSGTVSVVLSAENCGVLKALLSAPFEQLQFSSDDSSPLISKPSFTNRFSGHYAIEGLNLQVSLSDDTPSAALKAVSFHLEQLDLTLATRLLKQKFTLSVVSAHVDNMDHPKTSPHRCLFKADAILTFTFVKTLKDQIASSQLLLHLQAVKCGVYPKIVGAMTGFLTALSQDKPSSIPERSSPKFFSLIIQLEDVSFAFHSSVGTVAAITLPRSSFLVSSSDNLFEEWELEGTANDLQLKGPEFSTQGMDGIPFGSLDKLCSCVQLRLQKPATSMLGILVNLENVKCILRGDYLAVLIGFITSSDWHQTQDPDMEGEQATTVQYAVEVKNSLLILPTGGGCFTKIVIPEFKFSFIPPELKAQSIPGWAESSLVGGEKSEIFLITGKELSLSTYDKSEFPLINCLDGKIVIEVPIAKNHTRILLRFPVLDLLLAGKEFLEQIQLVEVLSRDLALVGKKSAFSSRIWECLERGESFVLETWGQRQEQRTLFFECCIDEFGASIFYPRKDNVWEEILTGKVGSVSSFWSVKGERIADLTVKITSMQFSDGGGNTRTVLNTSVKDTGMRRKTLMAMQSGTSEVRLNTAVVPSFQQAIDILLPNVEVRVEISSWNKIINWLFFCFPMVPSSVEVDDAVENGTSGIIQQSPASDFQLRVEVRHLAFHLPEYEGDAEPKPQDDDQLKTICFTSALCIKDFEFLGPKWRFLAQFSAIRAETIECQESRHPFFSGGGIQIKGELDLELQVTLALIIAVDFVDCWFSYPVLQFLNTFRLEAFEEEEESLGLDVAVKIRADIPTLSLLLTDGRWNYNCPLLELILGGSSVELSWSIGGLKFMISSLLEMSYHNIQKAVWEPFLEPWKVSAGISKGCDVPGMKLELISSSSLNINVTEGLFQTASRALEMVSWSSKEEIQYLERNYNTPNNFSHYAPYWFQNDTGMIVSYSLIWPFWKEECSSDWRKVLPGGSVPLFLDENEVEAGMIRHRKARWNNTSSVSERKKCGIMAHRRMSVRVEGTAGASLPMSIDLVGTRAFEVVFSKLEVDREGVKVDGNGQDQSYVFTTHALFEVSLQHHSKLIRLRSTVALANMTSQELEVRLEIPFGIAPKIMDPILPQEIVSLPLHLAENGRVRLRPYGKGFLWSEPHSLSKLISTQYRQSVQRPVLCYPPKPNDAPFRCCVSVEEKEVSVADVLKTTTEYPCRLKTWSIILQAPLVIRNCLPCSLDIEIESGAGVSIRTSVMKGDSVSVYDVDIVNDLNLKLAISKFLPSNLKFGRPASLEKSEISEALIFNPEDPSGRLVYARAEKSIDLVNGRREISISVPYWIFNCSGLDLAFLDGDVDLCMGKEQVLPDAFTKGAAPPLSLNSPGLKALLGVSSGCNTCLLRKEEPGRIASHLPSCRFFEQVQPPTAAAAATNLVIPDDASALPSALLYSPTHGFEVSEHRLRLRILQPSESSSASWTQPFLLDPPGGTTPIVVPQPESRGAYLLCLSSMPAMGASSGRTKTITFRPRFILANASRQEICFKQQGSHIIQHLSVGKIAHVHWTDMSRTLLLSVRYNEHGWDWSGGFSVDRLGDTQLKVHNHLSGTKEILRVEVSNPDAEAALNSGNKRLGGTFFIIVQTDDTGFMPYRIDNFSPMRLRFYQRRCENIDNVLQPYSSCDYAWDEPCLPPKLVLEVPGQGSLGAYELETVKSYPPIQLRSSGQKTELRFAISVHAEGARRVLSVVESSLHTQKDPKPLALRTGIQTAMEEFTLILSSIGVSLVDTTPQELVFASAKGLRFQLRQNDRQQEATLEIAGLQVDNQLRHATFPVMLSTANASVKHWGASEKDPEDDGKKPAISLAVSKWRHQTGSVDCFQCISLSITPLRLELEERNLTRVIGFLKSLTVGGSNMGAEKSVTFKVFPCDGGCFRFVEMAEAWGSYKSWPAPAAVEPIRYPTKRLIISAKQKKKTYVEAFRIDSLELTISFSSIPWLSNENRGVAAQSILWFTGSLLQRRLIALADAEGAPVRLRQLSLDHAMANWNAILGIIQRHYTRQLLHEVYKVLGSADVFGNPMGFMRSLGSGIWDFVSAPARSIRQNPVHVVQGVSLGTKSLLRNTVFAFSNAATQMSKAARKGVAVLVLDQDYVNEDEIHHYGRDSSVVNEFLEGLTGLLQSSVRGAERHGIPGVFSGMALGMVRAIARPAASILDVAGKTAQSIRNSSRPAQVRIRRVRLPRHLEAGSPLLPYSANEALGMAVILEAENGQLKDEIYVTCQELCEAGVFVLLTENLLLQAKWIGHEEAEWSIVSSNNVEDILYVDLRKDDGGRLEILFCTPNVLFRARGQHHQGGGAVVRRNVTLPSPFKNVTLSFGCMEAADQLHSALLHILGRKQNIRLSRGIAIDL